MEKNILSLEDLKMLKISVENQIDMTKLYYKKMKKKKNVLDSKDEQITYLKALSCKLDVLISFIEKVGNNI